MLVDIAQRGAGGVGVAPIGDHLHVGAACRTQSCRSNSGSICTHQQRAPRVDQGLDIARSLQVRDALEHARSIEPGEQLREAAVWS